MGWAPDPSFPEPTDPHPRLSSALTKHTRSPGIQVMSNTNLQASECWATYWKEKSRPFINYGHIRLGHSFGMRPSFLGQKSHWGSNYDWLDSQPSPPWKGPGLFPYFPGSRALPITILPMKGSKTRHYTGDHDVGCSSQHLLIEKLAILPLKLWAPQGGT